MKKPRRAAPAPLAATRDGLMFAIDLSSKAGVALVLGGADGGVSRLGSTTIEVGKPMGAHWGKYPIGLRAAARAIGCKIDEWFHGTLERARASYSLPTMVTVVVEECNLGRNGSRHVQRLLEWAHLEVFDRMHAHPEVNDVVYVDTTAWRRYANALKGEHSDVKHASVAEAARRFRLPLLQKDENEAEALLIGAAWCAGVPQSAGPKQGRKKANK